MTSSSINAALPYAAWMIALLSAAGSLFFSEVMRLPPCSLCWYQRVAMYPLIVIIGTAIITRDTRLRLYALPITLIGTAIAIYHNLLYYGIIPETVAPCEEGVPCNAVQLELLGFITIPLMGLAAFAAIALCLIFYKNQEV